MRIKKKKNWLMKKCLEVQEETPKNFTHPTQLITHASQLSDIAHDTKIVWVF